MDYTEWSSLKVGDRVKRSSDGRGTVISDIGIGYVVKFDNGNIKRIADGGLSKIIIKDR